MKSSRASIQIKATEQYFPVVWIVMLYKVVLIFNFLFGFVLNSQVELGRIKECLTRLFFDPHNKVTNLQPVILYFIKILS